MKVKIVSAKEKHFWYADKIGKTYKVESNGMYNGAPCYTTVLGGVTLYILPEDAEPVNENQKSSKKGE
ncbi:MAG: hypothetical protein D6800_11015 [Candidatus Zixiibacteriota bacterium]|nr:MAG: hypothetical protein D6800_11015 [candidate division Zixibacteria bacterium]